MALEDKTFALVLEEDQKIAEPISKMLKRRSYGVTVCTREAEALDRIKERTYPLAVVGHAHGADSPFEAMKEIVMISPMTSMILITDVPDEEVQEKAEGYGILGHAQRQDPSKGVLKLVKTFEEIFQSLAPPKK